MNKAIRVKPVWIVVLLSMVLLPLVALGWWIFRPAEPGVASRLVGISQNESVDAFERVLGPRELVFPADHGPHPDFLTEWWYYTGNLQADDGRRFGYQLTFFRRAVLPTSERPDRLSNWSAEQIYLAHFTLTDVAGRSFYPFERFERGAAGLAGAVGEPAYQVWVRDWTVEQLDEDTYHLRASEEGIVLDLRLLDRKGIILQGDRGYSRKGPEPGNASLYYSQTRLESQGSVTVNGSTFQVSGLSWLDREISTSVLSEGQVGWDWFAIQLDDGSEMMAFYLRRADGSIDPFSSGTFIQPDGTTIPLTRDDFDILPQGTWRSPHSGAEYPASWIVNVPSLDLTLQIQPLLSDQELNLSFIYWEGAVQINGTRSGQSVTGFGYVELTGYGQSMEDRF
jgi:predicted secreted hydrolase